jgi:hypothetical protein
MTPTQTQTAPQALTVDQIEALGWPDPFTSIPAWDRSVSTPYGVGWMGVLDGRPGHLRSVVAYLDDDSRVFWQRGRGWMTEAQWNDR